MGRGEGGGALVVWLDFWASWKARISGDRVVHSLPLPHHEAASLPMTNLTSPIIAPPHAPRPTSPVHRIAAWTPYTRCQALAAHLVATLRANDPATSRATKAVAAAAMSSAGQVVDAMAGLEEWVVSVFGPHQRSWEQEQVCDPL